MVITLTRYYTPFCALGELTYADVKLVTVERPWLGNKPFESCIPEGRYYCNRYSSPRFPNTWEVQNVPNRTYILFHRGNTASDVEGCIAVGESFDSSDYRIQNSVDGFSRFLGDLRDFEEFELEIMPYMVEYP